jgi:hypothetical protein
MTFSQIEANYPAGASKMQLRLSDQIELTQRV